MQTTIITLLKDLNLISCEVLKFKNEMKVLEVHEKLFRLILVHDLG